jgi:hypothetical protein
MLQRFKNRDSSRSVEVSGSSIIKLTTELENVQSLLTGGGTAGQGLEIDIMNAV